MIREEIEKRAKVFLNPVYSPTPDEVVNFAIQIHDAAIMQALIKARDDFRTPRSVLDGIRAMQIDPLKVNP